MRHIRGIIRITLIFSAGLMSVAPAAAQSMTPMFSKAFEPGMIGPGSVSTLRFTIFNPALTPAQDMAFTDNLPAGVTLATPASPASNCQGTLSAPDGGSTVSLTGGQLGAGLSCTITVQVTSSTPGTHTNVSGDLTSNLGNSGNAQADLVVVADRPGFSKSFTPESVSLGGRSTLTFLIDNTANNGAAFNLSFVDNLPSGLVVASPANAFTDCPTGVLSASPGSSQISYAGAFGSSLAAGASCAVTVGVSGEAVGSLINTSGDLTSATAAGGQLRSSGKASAVLTVRADRLLVSKSFTNDPVFPGGTVNLRFTIRNLNRESPAIDIALDDDLDAVLSGLEAAGLPLSDPCGPGSSLTGTSLISLTGGNLGPEGVCTFNVSLQVPAGTDAGAYPNTSSNITGEVDGEPLTGSPASDVLFVSDAPLLTKSFVDDPVGGGGSVRLEFTITNVSQDQTATDINFSDPLPVVLQTASATPADGFCGMGSIATFTPPTSTVPATIAVSGGSLGPGESCTFEFTLGVAVGSPGGTYLNTTSEIRATIDDRTLVGAPASDDLLVVSAPRLRKEFIDDPVAAGDEVTLRLTLTLGVNSPGEATDITFSDDLTATLSGLTAVGLPQSDVCGVGSEISGTTNLSFTGGTLQPGDSCSFDVTLETPASAAPGPHSNTTSSVMATVLGINAVQIAAADDLRIAGLTLSKDFTDDPARPGGNVTLRFTVTNLTAAATASEIFFTDDLDDVVPGLSGTGLPMNDVCGAGSSLTGSAGNTLLTFQGGTLGPGETCSFEVVLDIPSSADAGTYPNLTGNFRADFGGGPIQFLDALDLLVLVSEFLELDKEFTDDPAAPGETVNLRFTLTNLDLAENATDIAFTDDLDAALPGLAAISTPQNDVCGAGSMLTGASLLSLTGGSLGAGGSCSFDVVLQIPNDVSLGSEATNVTSEASGSIGGTTVTSRPATDQLQIDFLLFTKSFDGEVFPGDTVGLTFNIQNLDAADPASELSFTDDLNAVLSGLTAVGLPAADVCGAGSQLSVDGSSVLSLTGGNLLPGGSCTFAATLSVPTDAPAGTYLNTTSDLRLFSAPAAPPATASLVVLAVADEDGDSVPDDEDVCAGTVIPEGVPTVELGVNRFALVDDDGIFDTVPPKGQGPQAQFTITDTAGCSCEQIIAELGLGQGHVEFGCSLGVMREWVKLVSPSNQSIAPTAPSKGGLGR